MLGARSCTKATALRPSARDAAGTQSKKTSAMPGQTALLKALSRTCTTRDVFLVVNFSFLPGL